MTDYRGIKRAFAKLGRGVGCSLVLLLATGCANTSRPEVTPAPITQESPSMRTGKAIDAILYADSTQAELLANLKPYVEPMQSMDDVQKRLDLGICLGSGPGVMQCQVADSGLHLIFDPDKKLRLIRREARVVGGVSFPAMSITDRGFEWHGYLRWYEN